MTKSLISLPICPYHLLLFTARGSYDNNFCSAKRYCSFLRAYSNFLQGLNGGRYCRLVQLCTPSMWAYAIHNESWYHSSKNLLPEHGQHLHTFMDMGVNQYLVGNVTGHNKLLNLGIGVGSFHHAHTGNY